MEMMMPSETATQTAPLDEYAIIVDDADNVAVVKKLMGRATIKNPHRASSPPGVQLWCSPRGGEQPSATPSRRLSNSRRTRRFIRGCHATSTCQRAASSTAPRRLTKLAGASLSMCASSPTAQRKPWLKNTNTASFKSGRNKGYRCEKEEG